jgi:hypothetical protein
MINTSRQVLPRDEKFQELLQNMCPNIGEPSQKEFLELEGPGFLEMFGTFEAIIQFLQILQSGYACRKSILREMEYDEEHIENAADESIRLPSEVYELELWRLVRERIFPPFFVEFKQLCVRAKFLCIKRFSDMAKFNLTAAFLGQLEDSIETQLLYELKDSRDKEVSSQLLEIILAGKIRPTDDGDYTSSSSLAPAFFKFWCSLPSEPLGRPQLWGGEQ